MPEEALNEQAREIAERWIKNAERETPPFRPGWWDAPVIARAYLSLARQLTEAERENGRMRGTIEHVLKHGLTGVQSKRRLREALCPQEGE